MRKKLVIVATLGLGVVHRHVGVLHQCFWVRPIGRINADTNRARRGQVVGVDHDRRGERGNHFLGHLLGALVNVVFFAARQILQNHREFIATQSRHGVTGAHACRQPCGDAL